jgi:hypothetical protein
MEQAKASVLRGQTLAATIHIGSALLSHTAGCQRNGSLP